MAIRSGSGKGSMSHTVRHYFPKGFLPQVRASIPKCPNGYYHNVHVNCGKLCMAKIGIITAFCIGKNSTCRLTVPEEFQPTIRERISLAIHVCDIHGKDLPSSMVYQAWKLRIYLPDYLVPSHIRFPSSPPSESEESAAPSPELAPVLLPQTLVPATSPTLPPSSSPTFPPTPITPGYGLFPDEPQYLQAPPEMAVDHFALPPPLNNANEAVEVYRGHPNHGAEIRDVEELAQTDEEVNVRLRSELKVHANDHFVFILEGIEAFAEANRIPIDELSERVDKLGSHELTRGIAQALDSLLDGDPDWRRHIDGRPSEFGQQVEQARDVVNAANVFIQFGQVGDDCRKDKERTFLRMSSRNHYELLEESDIKEGDTILVIEENK